jgi:hypothetical protein
LTCCQEGGGCGVLTQGPFLSLIGTAGIVALVLESGVSARGRKFALPVVEDRQTTAPNLLTQTELPTHLSQN